jgi:acyl-CoA synthetase (AMP-forming)/AMP-acid ligase II
MRIEERKKVYVSVCFMKKHYLAVMRAAHRSGVSIPEYIVSRTADPVAKKFIRRGEIITLARRVDNITARLINKLGIRRGSEVI